MQNHLAHMAAGRHPAFRRALTQLARIVLFLPLAAIWGGFALSMLVAVVFGWYAAGALLIQLF